MKDQNYFSLDLELNSKRDGSIPKIIQVGISIGSPVRPNDIQTYSWYLNPEEPITPFITQLTGITDEIIKTQSVSHNTVAQEPEEEPEELKTLYQMLNDEEEFRDDICSVVKEWMSQYTHNVMTGEYLKGYEECLTVLEENLK